MNTNRTCGCKSFNTCYVCENELGIVKEDEGKSRLTRFVDIYTYCPESGTIVIEGDKEGERGGVKFPGFKIIPNFVSEAEESALVSNLDLLPWDASQSGRRKQNFGPKANFKKRKAKSGDFRGFPDCTKFIQDRFSTVPILSGYKTVEQCSIEYRPETGSCIEPHIDDCWIWGERIVQLNLLSSSFLTLFPAHLSKDSKRYNLPDVDTYPKVLDPMSQSVLFNPFNDKIKNTEDVEPYRRRGKCAVEGVVRVPLPRRSLLVMFDEPRYDWEHCVLREDIEDRRIVIAYREFTPTYLPGGREDEFGKCILKTAENFWK